ncbi:hypothetical protein SASPL_141541 [Salvia splendens]|uniref:Uncharacterized protein n=1 Tax=Salvia splendens TaxID=180675 RepID=A0A8X8WTV6_SALSN|nr:hypothetical protein SASPL_141541 [Salvia splendens]
MISVEQIQFMTCGIALCISGRVFQQIGPDSTALYVLPKLKELFDEFAFSQKNTYSVNLTGNMSGSKVKVGDSYRSVPDIPSGRRLSQNGSASENTSAKLLLNGVGWSRPQSHGKKSTKTITPSKSMYELYQSPAERIGTTSSLAVQEPWYWFPSPASNWNGLDFATHVGGLKVELPWKIRASIVQSVRAHHGALRSFVVCQNEYTVFTAGVGPGFKGNIQKWDLSRVDCMSSYNGHDENIDGSEKAIEDLYANVRGDFQMVLTICKRMQWHLATCTPAVQPSSTTTTTIWDNTLDLVATACLNRDGSVVKLCVKLPYVYFGLHCRLPVELILTILGRVVNDIFDLASSGRVASCDGIVHIWNGQTGRLISIGMLSSAFHGNSYTTMDFLGFSDILIVGTGNGSLRMSLEESMAFPSWIAAASSTGQCRLFDLRSGKIISSWQAHDGYVTELAATADYQLVSSSRIWDLRRNWSSEQRVFRGYSDGVSGFSVWGENIISICRNKIGLSSLQSPADEDGQYRASLQHVYMADEEAKNASVLSAITILPFSLLFLLGTEDGYLKICC